jgi:hypothetical protein
MEHVKMEVNAGAEITNTIKEAIALAAKHQPGTVVEFDFNNQRVVAKATDDPEELHRKWSADMDAAREAYINSPEYKERQEREAREHAEAVAAHMTEAAQTEAEMREAKVPTPLTKEQLTEYIESLVNRSHDYGTCVYAMSMAATAAFNYMAHQIGSSGFQASCADLDIVRRTRGINGPFMLVDGENALYPQYDLHARLSEAMEEWKPWLKEQAEKRLAETPENINSAVTEHWKKLAGVGR